MNTRCVCHCVKVERSHALEEDRLECKTVLEEVSQVQCQGSISALQLFFIAREISAWTNITKEIRLVYHVRDALDIRIAPLF